MKTASKTETKLIQHLMATPGNIVITAPRQCGVSTAIVKAAAQSGKRCLILSQSLHASVEMRKIWSRFRNEGCVHFESISSVRKDGTNENVTLSLPGAELPFYDVVYLDLAGMVIDKSQFWDIAKHYKGKIVYTSTGTNTKEWHKVVKKLVNDHGFTSLFANPSRHPEFLHQQKVSLGDDGFSREYMVNVTEDDDGQ